MTSVDWVMGTYYLFPTLINYVINLQVATVILKIDIKTNCSKYALQLQFAVHSRLGITASLD